MMTIAVAVEFNLSHEWSIKDVKRVGIAARYKFCLIVSAGIYGQIFFSNIHFRLISPMNAEGTVV